MAESGDDQALHQRVGARIRRVREQHFEQSQRKMGQSIANLDVAGAQGRIAAVEKGQASAKVIYAVLQHYYEAGVNLNYLFGPHPMHRSRGAQDEGPYLGNIEDYLREIKILLGESRKQMDEGILNTVRMEDYLTQQYPASAPGEGAEED